MTDNPKHQIDAAVDQARQVVSRSRLIERCLQVACSVAGLVLLAGSGFVSAGYRVPIWVYAAGVGLFVLLVVAASIVSRITAHHAARLIDERFGLDDGVSSAIGFEQRHREGGFYTLQRSWVASKLSAIDLSLLRSAPSRALIASAIAVPLIALALGFKGDSPAVIEARESFQRIEVLSLEIKEGLREEVEQIIEEATDEELEALNPNELLELVEELEVTGDQEQLLRQYAEMERAVSERAAALDRTRAEQLLAQAGAELSTSPTTQKLGQHLERKEFDKAAEELAKHKPEHEAVSEADLEKKRKELENLKAAASKLGEAARRFQAGSAGASASNTDGSLTEASDASKADQIAEQMSEIQQAAEELEKSLSQCENGQCSGDSLDKLAQCSSKASSSIDDLVQSKRQLDAKRKARSRLASMCKKLGQCQGAVTGQCQSPFSKPGGNKAGQGSADGENGTIDPETGLLDSITSIKNAQGQSQTTIEEADSGDGVSTRRTAARQQDYARQLESFVSRPDVPESVRQGVKTYFETIHQTAGEPEESDAPAEE